MTALHSLLPVVIGAAAGAAFGRFVGCRTGACPLTATWWRGAIYGATLGLLFALNTRPA
jgi:hypothetical protein